MIKRQRQRQTDRQTETEKDMIIQTIRKENNCN